MDLSCDVSVQFTDKYFVLDKKFEKCGFINWEVTKCNISCLVFSLLYKTVLKSWKKYLFHIFSQFWFTTSQMELDYYEQKVNIRVVTEVSERLKKLRDFKEILELIGNNQLATQHLLKVVWENIFSSLSWPIPPWHLYFWYF